MNSQMMKRARQLQKEMMETQKEIEETVFETTCGPVKMAMYGSKVIKEVKIDRDFEVAESDDFEIIEDSFVAASNKLNDDIDRFTNEKMAKYKAFLGGGF